ncbi:lichenicidin A2 family type 2 lantibiotic [Bacillus subtilis]|nr:mersacidin family lantibiotic [Bacillus subtilis]WGD68926.1 mersacidin family lantibiotic [Bacillus subtilis]WGD74042.1 mersacidin family lantibiotic [Bacillus subtilis]WGD90031.1 mersacidin family lantibiotic [Bacillus subtilis]
MENKSIVEKSCGKSMKSLSLEEMSTIYGAADADPRWTPAVSAVLSAVGRSTRLCISGIGSGISGIVSHNKDCLG